MKRQVFILLISVMCLDSSAQYWYNKYYDKSLSEMNSEELSFLYENARQTTATGVFMTITGTGLMVGSSIWFLTRALGDLFTWDYSGDSFYTLVSIAFYSGLAATAFGIPMTIVGSGRKITIKNAMSNQVQDATLQVIPSMRYNSAIRGYCTNLTITINF